MNVHLFFFRLISAPELSQIELQNSLCAIHKKKRSHLTAIEFDMTVSASMCLNTMYFITPWCTFNIAFHKELYNKFGQVNSVFCREVDGNLYHL